MKRKGTAAAVNSRTVVDAKKSAILTITPQDIAESKQKDPKHCAVAVSAIRCLHADEVRIHLSRAYVRKGEVWTRYRMDNRAARELVAFDRGGSFEPGVYRLNPVSPANRLGARTGGAWPEGKPAKKHLKGAVPLQTKGIRISMATNLHQALGA